MISNTWNCHIFWCRLLYWTGIFIVRITDLDLNRIIRFNILRMLSNYTKKYLIYGISFGFLFPLIALFVISFFPNNPWILFSIISSAPFFLGWFARMIGVRQDNLQEINVNLEKLVQERTSKIKYMLDVTGQGFFLFGADFVVKENYSRKCEEIFNKKPVGLFLPELLFSTKRKQEEFIDGFSLLFTDISKADVVFKLMDREIIINNRTIEIEYRMIDRIQVLGIMTDITLQLLLKEKEEKLRNMVFQILSHQKFFSSFLKEAEEVFQTFSRLEKVENKDYETLQRMIHTFKGSASFFAFEATHTAANDFENYISGKIACNETIDIPSQASSLKKAYKDESGIVLNLFGEQWLNRIDQVSIPYHHYLQLEESIAKKYGSDNEIFGSVQQFRRISLHALLAPYPPMSQRLAKSLGKEVKPLEIRGDDIQILPEIYDDLLCTFAHLVRNMIDHGIETPLERKKKNKPDQGEVFIDIKVHHDGMEISFIDDGRGISVQDIEAIGRRKGILSDDKIYNSDEVLGLLFLRDFSTAENLTEISGRGLGLWAVKTEIDRLKGRLSIETAIDKGTSISMFVPFQ